MLGSGATGDAAAIPVAASPDCVLIQAFNDTVAASASSDSLIIQGLSPAAAAAAAAGDGAFASDADPAAAVGSHKPRSPCRHHQLRLSY